MKSKSFGSWHGSFTIVVYNISGAVYAYCSVSTYECAQFWWQAPSADAYYADTESTDVQQLYSPTTYVSEGTESRERLLQFVDV